MDKPGYLYAEGLLACWSGDQHERVGRPTWNGGGEVINQ